MLPCGASLKRVSKRAPQLEAMNASVLVKGLAGREAPSDSLRVANGVSLRVSNPHLRLGPCTPVWLPDEREESIER
jgi:hypothetical protein